jgi:hypothetical protein
MGRVSTVALAGLLAAVFGQLAVVSAGTLPAGNNWHRVDLVLMFPLLSRPVPTESTGLIRRFEPVEGLRLHFRGAARRRDLNNPEHTAKVHQPYPDELSLSFRAFGESFNFTLSIERGVVDHEGFIEYVENGSVKRIAHELRSYSSKVKDAEINAVVHDDDTVHAIVNHPRIGIFQVCLRCVPCLFLEFTWLTGLSLFAFSGRVSRQALGEHSPPQTFRV